MTYQQFKTRAMKFTMAQLRFEVQPPQGVYDLLNDLGDDQLVRYDWYVNRLQREADANLSKSAFAAEWR